MQETHMTSFELSKILNLIFFPFILILFSVLIDENDSI